MFIVNELQYLIVNLPFMYCSLLCACTSFCNIEIHEIPRNGSVRLMATRGKRPLQQLF